MCVLDYIMDCYHLRGEGGGGLTACGCPQLCLALRLDDNDGLPVVHNLFDWLKSAFVETD